MAKFIVRKPATPGHSGKPLVASGLGVKYPAVWEYLTCTRFPDGSPRATSTLLVFVEDGAVKACISDRSQEPWCSLWVSGDGLDAVLEALEGHLQEGTGEWRVRKGVQPRTGKK